MNERLAQFLKLEGFTAVKFAEIMEVQPSSISHLLSGRNKPNFDFVARMLLRFPSLNPDWFINGITPVYRGEQSNEQSEITGVTNSGITTVLPEIPLQDSSLFDLDSPESTTADEITDVNMIQDTQQSDESQATQFDRLIERIVFFYNDGSFKEYHRGK